LNSPGIEKLVVHLMPALGCQSQQVIVSSGSTAATASTAAYTTAAHPSSTRSSMSMEGKQPLPPTGLQQPVAVAHDLTTITIVVMDSETEQSTTYTIFVSRPPPPPPALKPPPPKQWVSVAIGVGCAVGGCLLIALVTMHRRRKYLNSLYNGTDKPAHPGVTAGGLRSADELMKQALLHPEHSGTGGVASSKGGWSTYACDFQSGVIGLRFDETRMSSYQAGIVVIHVSEQAAEHGVKEGDFIVSVANTSVAGMGKQGVAQLISKSKRPVTVVFESHVSPSKQLIHV